MSATSKPTQTRRADQLLTVAEVARLDAVSERTVRRAIAAGLIDVVRVGLSGRSVRIDPRAHEAYRRRHNG